MIIKAKVSSMNLAKKSSIKVPTAIQPGGDDDGAEAVATSKADQAKMDQLEK